MEIVKFKRKGIVSKDENGHISLKPNSEFLEEESRINVEISNQELMKKIKEISDSNMLELSLAKASFLSTDTKDREVIYFETRLIE